MRWVRRKLRDTEVFARVRENGELAERRDGRVSIVYSLNSAARVYRAASRNLEHAGDDEIHECVVEELTEAGAPVIIYTDGACTGNPGPMGIGVVIMDGKERRELSEFLGSGTNNIAELTAIKRALEVLPDEARTRIVKVHTDSSYSIGLLTKNWKAKANTELVEELRALARRFPKLQMVKVKGHSGIPENERADSLAVDAIKNRDGS
jgi:ribonuclease HI